jgi:uncharacterized membrane protein YdbT with pleckstrin-like domain
LSEIARRVWHEPAVFIGLVTSAALAIITIATGDPWDTAAIIAIIAPLASALGIRQYVTPTYDDKPTAGQ